MYYMFVRSLVRLHTFDSQVKNKYIQKKMIYRKQSANALHLQIPIFTHFYIHRNGTERNETVNVKKFK